MVPSFSDIATTQCELSIRFCIKCSFLITVLIHLRYYMGKAERNYYSLTWTVQFNSDRDTCYFAHCYPYTYSDMQVLISTHIVQSNIFILQKSSPNRQMIKTKSNNLFDMSKQRICHAWRSYEEIIYFVGLFEWDCARSSEVQVV